MSMCVVLNEMELAAGKEEEEVVIYMTM